MSKKTIFLLTIFLIVLTEIFAQGNQHKDLEYIFRDKPIYKVEIQTYLRQNDFSESAIKAQIPKGSKVIVINSYFREKWEVLYKGERGWVNRSYLSFYQPGLKNISETNILDSLYKNQPIYFVKSESFLKEHMSHQSATLVSVPKGVKVKVINSLFQDWWEVLYDNRRGNLQKSILSYQEISMPEEQEKKPEQTLVQMEELEKPIVEVLESEQTEVQVAEPEQIREKGAEPERVKEQEEKLIGTQEKGEDSVQNQRNTQNKNQTILDVKTAPSIDTIKYSKKVIKATSLRKDSNSKSKVILRFKAGNEVSVIDESDRWWAKVIYKEKVGWVKKSLLKDLE